MDRESVNVVGSDRLCKVGCPIFYGILIVNYGGPEQARLSG